MSNDLMHLLKCSVLPQSILHGTVYPTNAILKNFLHLSVKIIIDYFKYLQLFLMIVMMVIIIIVNSVP